MSGHQYNSVLRSGLTRRLWAIIALAMLVPVTLAVVSHWLEAEERRARLQNQELTALSRDKASSLLFNARAIPADFSRDLEGRYLVVLDGAGAARFSNAPVPDELVQLFAHRSPHAMDAPSSTTIPRPMLPTISPSISRMRELMLGLAKCPSQTEKKTSRVRGLVPAMELDSGSLWSSKSAGRSSRRVGRMTSKPMSGVRRFMRNGSGERRVPSGLVWRRASAGVRQRLT